LENNSNENLTDQHKSTEFTEWYEDQFQTRPLSEDNSDNEFEDVGSRSSPTSVCVDISISSHSSDEVCENTPSQEFLQDTNVETESRTVAPNHNIKSVSGASDAGYALRLRQEAIQAAAVVLKTELERKEQQLSLQMRLKEEAWQKEKAALEMKERTAALKTMEVQEHLRELVLLQQEQEEFGRGEGQEKVQTREEGEHQQKENNNNAKEQLQVITKQQVGTGTQSKMPPMTLPSLCLLSELLADQALTRAKTEIGKLNVCNKSLRGKCVEPPQEPSASAPMTPGRTNSPKTTKSPIKQRYATALSLLREKDTKLKQVVGRYRKLLDQAKALQKQLRHEEDSTNRDSADVSIISLVSDVSDVSDSSVIEDIDDVSGIEATACNDGANTSAYQTQEQNQAQHLTRDHHHHHHQQHQQQQQQQRNPKQQHKKMAQPRHNKEKRKEKQKQKTKLELQQQQKENPHSHTQDKQGRKLLTGTQQKPRPMGKSKIQHTSRVNGIQQAHTIISNQTGVAPYHDASRGNLQHKTKQQLKAKTRVQSQVSVLFHTNAQMAAKQPKRGPHSHSQDVQDVRSRSSPRQNQNQSQGGDAAALVLSTKEKEGGDEEFCFYMFIPASLAGLVLAQDRLQCARSLPGVVSIEATRAGSLMEITVTAQRTVTAHTGREELAQKPQQRRQRRHNKRTETSPGVKNMQVPVQMECDVEQRVRALLDYQICDVVVPAGAVGRSWDNGRQDNSSASHENGGNNGSCGAPPSKQSNFCIVDAIMKEGGAHHAEVLTLRRELSSSFAGTSGSGSQSGACKPKAKTTAVIRIVAHATLLDRARRVAQSASARHSTSLM
jgi:hypothetical protein